MIKKPTDRIKDIDTREHLDFIYQEGLGNAIELDAAPTATTPLLSDNEVGVYLDKIYVRKSNKIYRLDPDLAITIT